MIRQPLVAAAPRLGEGGACNPRFNYALSARPPRTGGRWAGRPHAGGSVPIPLPRRATHPALTLWGLRATPGGGVFDGELLLCDYASDRRPRPGPVLVWGGRSRGP